MLSQKFVSGWVFLTPTPDAPEMTSPDLRMPHLHMREDLLLRRTVCFLGHSVLDDLRLLLEESDSDLHHDFNLHTVIPMWKTVRG